MSMTLTILLNIILALLGIFAVGGLISIASDYMAAQNDTINSEYEAIKNKRF
jgi:hypothetical protein